MQTMEQVFRSLNESESPAEITDERASQVSTDAAMLLAGEFKRAGFKPDVIRANGWGISSVTVPVIGMRIPIMIGVQNLPKGVDLHIEFQSPMFGGDRWDEAQTIIASALLAARPMFSKDGADVRVGEKGRNDWPYLWIYPGKNVKDVVQQFPEKIATLGANVAKKLSSLEGK